MKTEPTASKSVYYMNQNVECTTLRKTRSPARRKEEGFLYIMERQAAAYTNGLDWFVSVTLAITGYLIS